MKTLLIKKQIHLFTSIIREEKLGNIFRELQKTGSHPGLNWGPLTLVVSALPPELCTCTMCACIHMYFKNPNTIFDIQLLCPSHLMMCKLLRMYYKQGFSVVV